jgi:hypothetical protein
MTEQTGWPAQPDPAQPPVPTAEQQAEAARQLAAQNVGVTGPQVGSPVDLGRAAVAAGAEAADVDANELLASIRALQNRVNLLEAEKRAASAPAVVRYAEAIRDHLATKAAQHPAVQADPDHSYGKLPDASGAGGLGVLGAASHLAVTAAQAADSGKPGSFGTELGHIVTWVQRHARRFPAIDHGYILELAEEAALAATKLAA